MVLTKIKERSCIKKPYLNHKLVDKQPLTNGNDDKSPVLLFCTIFWQIKLKKLAFYKENDEKLRFSYVPVKNCRIVLTEAVVARIFFKSISFIFNS